MPWLPVLVSCFVSLLYYSISPLVLVAILSYIHTYTPVPALVLPNQVTLYLDPLVTLSCVIYHFRNNPSQTNHVCTSNTIGNRLPNTCHSTTPTVTTNWPTELACAFVPPPRKPNTTRVWHRTYPRRYTLWHTHTCPWGFQRWIIVRNRRPYHSHGYRDTGGSRVPKKILPIWTTSRNHSMSRRPSPNLNGYIPTTTSSYSPTEWRTQIRPT